MRERALHCGGDKDFRNNSIVHKGKVYLELGPSRGSAAKLWQPDVDDGDGARMEDELCISVQWSNDHVTAFSTREALKEQVERLADHAYDRRAARRTASLKYAASLGELIATQERK